MNEKKYLKLYNKLGYGCGDIAGNVVYGFLSAFMLIFLTDSIGMNAGVIGILIMVSKFADGVTDIFFGNLIDKTHSRLGKARPWMLYGYIGCAAMLVAIFMIPESLGDTAKYAYFFIAYTLLNAVFYTANNIAYASLTSLITKNNAERVQLGSFRFIFAFATNMVLQAVTVGAVAALGNDTAAWRKIAVIYAIIGLITNTLSVFSVHELNDEKEDDENEAEEKSGVSIKETLRSLVKNKYYFMIVGVYVLSQFYVAFLGMGIYYMTYILGDAGYFGSFSLASNMPLIIALLFSPILIGKFGMYKVNLAGYGLTIISRILLIISAGMGSIPLMLVFSALSGLGMAPMQGDLNALIASASDYTYKTTGKRIDGSMYSCSSFGMKIGSGLGSALTGMLLSVAGYVGTAEVQSASALNMISAMYLWAPTIIAVIVFIILTRLDVEKANRELDEKMN